MKLMIANSVFVLLSISCSNKKSIDDVPVFTGADAKTDFQKGNYRLLTYGLIDDPIYEYRDSLAKSYGFYFDNQGCAVTDSAINGYDQYNFSMELLLEKKNGKYWKKDFDWKIDSVAHLYDLKHRNDTE